MSKLRTILEATFKEFYKTPTDYVIEVTIEDDDNTYYITDLKGENLTRLREEAYRFSNFEEANKALHDIYKNHINRSTYNPNEVGKSAMGCFVNGEFRVYEIYTTQGF